MRRIAILGLTAIAGCTVPAGSLPSLAPRAAEAIDPRVPIPDAPTMGPVTPSLATRLDTLIRQAREGDAAFEPTIAEAQRLADAAGGSQSESWVAAQQALSAAIAAREPVTKALGDIDALGSTALAAKGGLSRADQQAIERAAAVVKEVDDREAAAIDALQRRLGS